MNSTNSKTLKVVPCLLLVASYLFFLIYCCFSPTNFIVKAATKANINSTEVTDNLQNSLINASTKVNSKQKIITYKGSLISRANPQQLLHITISLKERDSQAETQFIEDLYNPNSPTFHHYLTPSEYAEKFGPTTATRAQVADYLKSQGFKITQNNPNGTLINFDSTVIQTEKTFQLNINNYTGPSGRTFYGNDRTPILPSSISSSVLGIIGLSNENQPKPFIRWNDKNSSSITQTVGQNSPRRTPDGTGYSPIEIRNAYNVTPLYAIGYQGQGEKVALYENDGYDPADIAVYTSTLGLTPPPPIAVSVDNAPTFSQDGQNGQDEVELDMEGVYAIAPQAQLLVYVGRGSIEAYQQIALDDNASQISTSWGDGDDITESVDSQMAKQQIFRQFALQGQSFYSASSDDDSYAYPDYSGKAVASSPANDPYVTAVGGTSLYITGTESTGNYQKETTWNDAGGRGTGGGLSVVFYKTETPWQIGLGTDLSGTLNPQGFRQIPDIAADADPTTGLGIYTNLAGSTNFGASGNSTNWYAIGGTSLASPLWAGFTAIINQYATINNGTAVGFASPALYSILNDPNRYARDFHDITVGNNDKNCPNDWSTHQPLCMSGFNGPVYYNSAVGYDLATGIGTPNVANLADDLAAMSRNASFLVAPNPLVLGTGNSPLSASATVTLSALKNPVNFTVSGLPEWLSLSTLSGSVAANTSQTITATALPTNYPTGLYTAHLTINDTLNPNNPTSLVVQLEVNRPLAYLGNTAQTNPIILTYHTSAPQPPTATVTVTPTFSCNFTAVPNRYLQISPIAGLMEANKPFTFTVSLDTGLTPNIQSSSFNIYDSDDLYDYNGLVIPIQVVQDVTINPSQLTFNTQYGSNNPPPETFTVSNSPTAPYPVTVTLGVNSDTQPMWLQVPNQTWIVPPGSSTTISVNASLNNGQTQPGQHISTLEIVQSNGFKQALSSQFIVTGVGVPPDSLHFTSTLGGPQIFSNITVTTQPITSTLTSVSGSAEWFQVSIISNISGYLRLGIQINPASLKIGSYTGMVSVETDNAGALTVPISLQIIPPPLYTYNLPFLAKNYTDITSGNGTYTTYLAFQNVGANEANIELQYFDVNGNPIIFSGSNCASVAQNGECVPVIPLADGTKGGGILTSDQPLAVIIAEATPYGGSAYPVSEGSSASLVTPLALNHAYGGFSTKLNVFNPNNQDTEATIVFYDANGNLQIDASKSIGIPAHGSVTLDQSSSDSGLPTGFQGWSSIFGINQSSLVAQTLEQNPNTGFVAILNAQSLGAATKQLYAPAIFNQGFGSFVTGMSLVNVAAIPTTVTVSYYRNDGNLVKSVSYNLPGYGVNGIYNGGNRSDIPNGFVGAAAISSSASPLVMAVNESGGGGARQSGVYLAASSGASSVGLPVMAKNGLGYTTGATILNTSNQPVTVNLQYYNLDGTTAGGGDGGQTVTIEPNASYAVYQGAVALGDSFYGTAIVNEMSGPPNALLITTNAQSSNFFYTYIEPN